MTNHPVDIDGWDDPDAVEEIEGFHMVGEDCSDVIVCTWGCGDSEGLCTVDKFGCYTLGCEHSRA